MAGAQETPRRGLSPTARFRTAAPTQDGEDRLGDEGAVGVAELPVLAEVARNDAIGGVLETQDLGEKRYGVGEEGGSETGFHGLPSSTACSS